MHAKVCSFLYMILIIRKMRTHDLILPGLFKPGVPTLNIRVKKKNGKPHDHNLRRVSVMWNF